MCRPVQGMQLCCLVGSNCLSQRPVDDLDVAGDTGGTWVYEAEMDTGTTYPANTEYIVWYERDVPRMVGP